MQEQMQLFIYVYEEGSEESPFDEWKDSLGKREKAFVHIRLTRVRAGNLGNWKIIKGEDVTGLYELKINDGPGYRIYFGKEDNTVIILLCGGDKGSQNRDIKKAASYWKDYKASKGSKKKGVPNV